ncbi:hypothetical protein DFR52_101470 [Hoeflea marina]|uniref:(S)-ureidoglycine aminohydrolase cupin domain-containing protein n=1 Tax=Hoeflea marina TaxID=274592 RepID=A0A317PQP4_9HYPH|nr:cupin domain-containing protein [Hoeflea marina]PWW03782.1 hypothetical protein DFR52_101470 [Hoeflea marina]
MTTPISFNAAGPQGWAGTDNVAQPTAELIEGNPVGLDHAYFTRPEAGVRAGIWRSEAYTEFYESYPCDEFMCVLSGSVTIESDSFSQTYRQGDAFLIPKGFRGFWRQTEAMQKYYVIIE